jgi:hypothetical protein
VKYLVTHKGKNLYKGDSLSEAFTAWEKTNGRARINVPMRSLPKMFVGDEYRDLNGVVWRVEDFEVKHDKRKPSIIYYVSNSIGERKIVRQEELPKFKKGGIVEDYQRVKEGIIFKNEYLARVVESLLEDTPEFWYERVGKMIYVSNSDYLDALQSRVDTILSQIEGTTDYVSKMINNKPIRKYQAVVQYEKGEESFVILAFSKKEAEIVAKKRAKEKSKLNGKKIEKIQILAVQS